MNKSSSAIGPSHSRGAYTRYRYSAENHKFHGHGKEWYIIFSVLFMIIVLVAKSLQLKWRIYVYGVAGQIMAIVALEYKAKIQLMV